MGELSAALLGLETDREDVGPTVNVGTASGRLVPANPNRVFLYLANPSTNDVFVAPETSVAVDEGYIVPPGNGSLTFEVGTDGDITGAEFHAIANGGAVDLIVRGEQAAGPLPQVPEETS
jgi:hypothetical protein